MANKPRIRFRGFTEDWEQCKLGDLAEIVRGASPRPISDPKWFDNNSNVGWLRIADVTVQDGRIRYLEQKISELAQEKTRVIKTPHLLLSIAGTVGKPVINYVPTGVHDGFLIFLNPKFNILYTFWWLEMFREKWNKYGQPGSQVNLNSDLVKNQVINIPNEKEQEKISSFLEALDKIITLHQRKLKNLNLAKKALLQKLFPKNGSQFPGVRFKIFCDSWKPHKLGHYFKKYQNVIYLEDDVLYKQISVRNNGVIEYRCSTKGQDIGRKRQYIIDTMLYPDTLTFTRQTVYEGGIGFVPKTLDGAIVTENMPLLAMRNSNKDFMMALFNSQSYISGVLNKNALSGSAQKALHERDWLNSVLLFPDIEEQKLIGCLINIMDKNIDLHCRKLDKLYGVKKGLLQKMFV